ncbi:hypothetical protein SLEP1_g51367 [Rubroshorea leprosula]|uniref:GDSL esterase/lipase n=1 Tax=Rubroshorea leprosula TaxID=152421 RepID=A0AAV5M4G6_9ROSI|nr:hypothetical protein SLEP1_g51367 [Rubroshorea leprosula]
MTRRSAASYLDIFFWWSLVAMTMLLAQAEKPATYIFGDSAVDDGTNDYVEGCLAMADFLFNGIDLLRLLGYKRSPPPYYYHVVHPSAFKQNILYGVNIKRCTILLPCHSGGAGILNETGQTLYVSFISSVQQFSYVREVITNMTGSEQATSSKAFFLISVGSNHLFDYLNNQTVSPQEFLQTTLTAYQTHGFYNGTDDFLSSFSYAYPDVKYSLGNIFQMTNYIIDDPLAFGKQFLSFSNFPSFYLSVYSLMLMDFPAAKLYRYHPTEAVSELAALTLFGGSVELVKPVNFSQLLQVNGQEIFH